MTVDSLMRIKTNNQWRETLTWHDLTTKEQAEFDYLDNDDKRMCATFVRYKGWTYDLAEFERTPAHGPFPTEWHGYQSDSFFSGVLVAYSRDMERVIMATYYS